MKPNDSLAETFSRLLNRQVTALDWIGGGGNSRVYKLTCAGAGPFAGKIYFGQRRHNRSRLEVEFSALQFLWRHGVRCIPQAVAANPATGGAVYEYVEGRKIPSGEVTSADIDSAVEFLGSLKQQSAHDDAHQLPEAAEACFSAKAIVANIKQRLERLSGVPPDGPHSPALHQFLLNDFAPFLGDLTRWCQAQLAAQPVQFDADVPQAERTLSPSDFGFHNTLRRPDGRLVFLDFEYFGWDDPAKMVSDFVLHPGMDLAENLKHRFVSGLYRSFADHNNLAKRVESVYPLFGLKWCLIILNEFVTEDLRRRDFASGSKLDKAEAQARQLEKARRMLARIRSEYDAFPYRD